MRVEASTIINRRPQDVFDYLTDFRHQMEWNSYARRVEQVTPGPVGPGIVFHGVYDRFGEVDETLAVYEPERRLMFTTDTSKGRSSHTENRVRRRD